MGCLLTLYNRYPSAVSSDSVCRMPNSTDNALLVRLEPANTNDTSS